MAPNFIRAFLFKHQREKVKDPQAMITILIILHDARDSKVMILQVNNLNIFLKEMYQKSKMDTTIDFVKHPKHSRTKNFLEHFFLFQKSGIGES